MFELTLISFIYPTKNRAKFLERSIRRDLNQAYSNIEIIVINDCSSDLISEIAISILVWNKMR